MDKIIWFKNVHLGKECGGCCKEILDYQQSDYVMSAAEIDGPHFIHGHMGVWV